ncbi:MAG: hypothetical protein WBX25_21865 [Rhodomicrobium sp.]
MAEFLNLKGIVLAGLMQAQKLIQVIDDPAGIDPQFHIMTPEGDFWISMTLAEGTYERMLQLQAISKFMAWKTALVFTMAAELTNPSSVYCFGATHNEQIAAISIIEREPIRFSDPEWLGVDQIGEEILGLLPQGEVILSEMDLAQLDAYFGLRGEFPAVRLAGGVS